MNKANDIRKTILKMMHDSKSSHIGSCLSIVDVLYSLYFNILNVDPKDPSKTDRDKLILSKAHASAALYAVLAEKGFFPSDCLNRFYRDGGELPGHLDKESIAGVEVSGGSLGHGLSIGVGMAIANRLDRNPGRIYVVLGDGECNEGSVWEAAMSASTLNLDNLTAIIDWNGLQGFGFTDNIVNMPNPAQRWNSFGWDTMEIDGHNVEEITGALRKKQKGPKAVIAHTVKGKGVSFMENSLEWHYKSPNNEQLEQALREIEGILS